MQHHTHNGKAPSHGFKVGVATLAVARLYETMLKHGRIEPTGDANPAPTTANVDRLFEPGELRDKAIEETKAKKFSAEHAKRLQAKWPDLKEKLRAQLPSVQQVTEMLRKAGAPTEPEQIGISKQRLRNSFRMAYHIRRRFTILDVAVMTGLLDRCLDQIF
jgi:glycerol-1-phosphate dehydrogenase [NAD(P)+]